MIRGLSPLARTLKPRLRLYPDRGGPFGLEVHTTGRGLVERALGRHEDPLQHALDYYALADCLAHYVGGHRGLDIAEMGGDTGCLVQLVVETERAPHSGVRDHQRAAYLDGSWERKVSAETLALWTARWPGYRSPAHLYPSRSPNQDYVGLELLPIAEHCAEPHAPGMLFTRAQHDLVVALGRDLATRWAWPRGWQQTGRLVGHEDVSPWPSDLDSYGRSDAHGGWDPGGLRAHPYFDWAYVLGRLE